MKAQLDMVLVISEAFPNGQIFSQKEYRALVRIMDRTDLMTHMALAIDPDTARLMQEICEELDVNLAIQLANIELIS